VALARVVRLLAGVTTHMGRVRVLALLAALAGGCSGSGAVLSMDPDAGDEIDAGPGADGGGGDACDPSVTYASFGQSFLDSYCNRCHAFTQQVAEISGSALSAAAGTGTFMPPTDPKPTAAQRHELAAWIACGAP
jgi:hypothetical protein